MEETSLGMSGEMFNRPAGCSLNAVLDLRLNYYIFSVL